MLFSMHYVQVKIRKSPRHTGRSTLTSGDEIKEYTDVVQMLWHSKALKSQVISFPCCTLSSAVAPLGLSMILCSQMLWLCALAYLRQSKMMEALALFVSYKVTYEAVF